MMMVHGKTKTKGRTVSIVIPTYNNESTLGECLRSIKNQDYPQELIDIIIADGGSNDRTVEIGKSFDVMITHNPFRVEERGRPHAIEKYAKGEIIGSIDADNILPNKDWITRAMRTFDDPEISAVDSLFFSYRPSDNLITKYATFPGGDDPIAAYLGINDRLCFWNGRWTGMPHKEEDMGDYLKVSLVKGKIPALGCNGYFFRKKIFDVVPHDPFIHSIFVKELVNRGFNKMAKVKQGLIHLQSGEILPFFKKKLRRIFRRQSGEISAFDYGLDRMKVILSLLYISTIVLPLKDMVMGFIRKPSLAWAFHPVATFGLFGMYAYHTIKGVVQGDNRLKVNNYSERY